MERIEEQKNYTNVYYKSWDGEIYRTEEECLVHENKPNVKAWKGVQSFLIRKTKEWKMFSVFNVGEEYPAYIFRPTSHEDIEALNTYINTDEYGNATHYEYVNDSYIGKEVFIINALSKHPYLMDELVTMFKEHLQYILNTDETDTDYDDDEEKIIRFR